MDNNLRSQLDSMLQRILNCSVEYIGRVSTSKALTRQANDWVHSISLPEPPSLLAAMVDVGAPNSVAEEMQRAYQQRATELKKRYEAAAFQATLALSQGPGPSPSPSLQPKLFTAIKKLYTERLEDWRKACLSLYESRTTISANQGEPSRRGRGMHVVFNVEYVPLLEHFFQENPFPTHAEKVLLAKKSGMTYRQIHVWFQNKRTRSRKEGKGSRKKTVLNGAAPPVDSRYVATKQRLKRNNVRIGPSPSKGEAMVSWPLRSCATLSDRNGISSGVQNPLDAPAPPYAFPSTYPPPLRYKPFQENRMLQSHLPWRRRPSPVQPPSLQVVGVSDLIEMFSQLNVRDDYCHQFPHVRSDRTQEIGAAVASVTVKPFSAPLFATCQPATFVTKTVFVPFPTVAAPTPLHPFQTPGWQAEPLTLMHASIQKTSKGGRKVAPLPKRVRQVSVESIQNLTGSTPDYSNHRSLSSDSSVPSSSPELSPSIAISPEVGFPSSLSLLDEAPPALEPRIPAGLQDDSSGLNCTPNVISESSAPQGNASAIMRVMRRAVPPPHVRPPLCVGS